MKSFRRSSSRIARRQKVPSRKTRFDGSARKRGYDAEWDKLSRRYRKSVRGLCEECYRAGLIKTCDVVDHMIPISENPDLRLSWANLDALCHSHHNGFKRRLEKFARSTQQVQMLPIWIKRPETRPVHFAIRQQSPNVTDEFFISRQLDRDNLIVCKPVLFEPTEDGVSIFEGPGLITSISNFSNSVIEVCDNQDPVAMVGDGQNEFSQIEILMGLSIRSTSESTGKVSIYYAQTETHR